jgi:hypothetical protein
VTRSELIERLGLAFEWYRGMVSPETGRLAYLYRPVQGTIVADGQPVRDIGTIWDVAILSRFLTRSELKPVIERSLDHYTSLLVPHGRAMFLDSRRLGEPSSIAHSAFLALALLASGSPDRGEIIDDLACGIVDQQREDGSYGIYFGGEPDDGLELYPGEAMLAIMEVYAVTHDPRYLASVERGFAFHRDRMPASEITPLMLVFHANWQAQYGSLLHEHSRGGPTRAAVRDHVFSLHDRVVRSGFYDRVERSPAAQATVEVACALEGISDAYAIAARERDVHRMDAYARCSRTALAYLLRAQRLAYGTPRERGGFGHTLAERTQRIDVTGHVVGGVIKSLRNRITRATSRAS